MGGTRGPVSATRRVDVERLARRDLLALLEFLRGLYVRRDLDAFLPHVCATLPMLVRADIRSFDEMDRRRGRARAVVEPAGLKTRENHSLFERHLHEHPLVNHYHRTNDHRVLKISDFLSRRRFRRLGLYNEFFRPLGVEHQIALNLATTRPLVVGFGLGRKAPDFSERERALLDLARPHLVEAYRNADALTRLNRALELTDGPSDGGRAALVPLTTGGRPRGVGAFARRCFARYFGVARERRGELPDDLVRWVQRQRTLLRHPDGLGTPPVPLVVRGRDAQLVVRLLREAGEATTLLLQEEATDLEPARLEPLGLTPREAEVLAWIAQGQTNKEVAATLGTSARTIQKHLERIFTKLGVSNRTAAAAHARTTLLAPRS